MLGAVIGGQPIAVAALRELPTEQSGPRPAGVRDGRSARAEERMLRPSRS